MKFRAALWTKSGLELDELEPLPLRPRDSLVRVEASNVGAIEGFMLMRKPKPAADAEPGGEEDDADYPPFPMPTPHIPGHAAVGVVEKTGEGVEGVEEGDRVLMCGTTNCGICFFCQRGRYDQCARMVFYGPATARTVGGTDVYPMGYIGSFAEYAVVPDIELIPIRSDLPADQLSLIPNPVCTGVGAALKTAPIEPGSVVAVVGCGPLGIAYIQAARLAMAEQIIAIDPLPQRREAADRFGATTVIDPTEVAPVEAVCDLTEDAGGTNQGRGADFVFEASREARAIEQAWEMARSAGSVTLAGLSTDPEARVSFPMMQFSNWGKTIYSCQQGSLMMRRDLPWMVMLAERGLLDLAGMAERSYALDETLAAMQDVADCTVLGATVIPNT